MNTTPDTIERITVSGYQGIRGQVDIFPGTKYLQEICGGNGSGKSSLIRAISEIPDAKGVKLITAPINFDADEAWVEIQTTGETPVIARKVWKKQKDSGTLTVKDASTGERLGSPVETLAKLTGGEIFNPMDFVNLDGPKQRAYLLKKVALPFDLDALEADEKVTIEKRKAAGRVKDERAAQLKAFPPADPSLPAEETPAATILAELDQVRRHNAETSTLRTTAQRAAEAVITAHAEAARLYAEFEKARDAHTARQEEAAVATAASERATFKDEAPLTAALAAADQTNAAIRTQKERAKVAEEAAAAVTEHATLDARVKEIAQTKKDGLKNAVWPVEGMSVDADGITINGAPFKGGVNTAEQIIAAYDLATAPNPVTGALPKIRISFITNGDMLDDKSLARITAIAESRQYTLFIERDRGTSHETGFSMEIEGMKW